MKNRIAALPLWLRKFIVDAIEGSVAAALALQVAIPASTVDARNLGLAVGIGCIHAVVAAARRALPDFGAWLASAFGTSQS